jgi:putative colanic acid biosynthesis acetyltransferase WcaF
MITDRKEQQTPYDSPWRLGLRIRKLLWDCCWMLFCGWTPKPFNAWRLGWLRFFGAEIAGKPFVHQRARIEMPWNLALEDRACVGDRTHLYNLARITLGQAATVAQEAYLCAGTHDFSDPSFPLVTKSIRVGAGAFIGARAFILPGVEVGEGAIVGAMAVVTRNVVPGTIMAGNPAREIGRRKPEPHD